MSGLLPSQIKDGKIHLPKINVAWIVVTFLIGSMSFITALQWQEAMSASITQVQKSNKLKIDPLAVTYISAILTTVIVVLIILAMYFSLRASGAVQRGEHL
jgi:anti-anti-sigma regulatory factor